MRSVIFIPIWMLNSDSFKVNSTPIFRLLNPISPGNFLRVWMSQRKFSLSNIVAYFILSHTFVWFGGCARGKKGEKNGSSGKFPEEQQISLSHTIVSSTNLLRKSPKWEARVKLKNLWGFLALGLIVRRIFQGENGCELN